MSDVVDRAVSKAETAFFVHMLVAVVNLNLAINSVFENHATTMPV